MVHVTIKRVTEDIEKRIQFNTAIAAIMEFVNHLQKFYEGWMNHTHEPSAKGQALFKEALETLILLLSPFAPHIAEEMWERLGQPGTLLKAGWPEYNEEYLRADEIEIVIQVNGKVRQKLLVPEKIDEASLKVKSLEDPRIREWTDGKEAQKVIVVPKKLVDIVAI